MPLFHELFRRTAIWSVSVGFLSLALPSLAVAEDEILVCVPVVLDDEQILQRDPGYPVVRCIISDPSANDNVARQNALTTPVLAQVQPAASVLEDQDALDDEVMDWLHDADLEYPFGLESLDGMSQVARFVRFYLTEGRGRLGSYFARAGRYEAMIRAELERLDAPQDLLWVVAIESNFRLEAESHAGAAGMWQFMPRTARARGMIVDRSLDERLDPEIATTKAIEYLLYQRERFGAWPLALAAYNAGSGHVRSQIQTWGVTELDAMERYGAVYQNARSYASKVIALGLIDRNRELLGFDAVVPDEPVQWDTVRIDEPVRLSLIASAAQVTVGDLVELNPALIGKAVPEGGWDVRLPPGTYKEFVNNYDRVAARYGKDHEAVTLRFGETLAMLAKRYDVPERVLRAVNDYTRRESVPYGTEVVVPQGHRDSKAVVEPSKPTDKMTVVVPAKTYEYDDRQRIFYEVHTRDSLQEIAEYFEVSVYELAAWNELSVHSTIWQGMVLQIFTDKPLSIQDAVYRTEDQCQVLQVGSDEWNAWRAQKAEATARARTPRTVTVKKGDTVLGIANRHGIDAKDLVRWNRLKDSSHIILGQKLYITPRR